MNSWLIGSRRCGAVVVTMAASARHTSKAPSSHRFPQMCAVLQPLRDNMAQSSSFVQVCFFFHKLFHYVPVIFLLPIHHFCLTVNCMRAHQPPLSLSSPSAIHPLCLQAVCDIADQVSARSRTAFSVSAHGHSVHLHSNQHEPRRITPSCVCAAAFA